MTKGRFVKLLKIAAVIMIAGMTVMKVIARAKKKEYCFADAPKEKNPLAGKKVVFVADESDKENADGVKGHLEAVGDADYKPNIYEKYVKRGIDFVLSGLGLIALSPVLLGLAIAIKIDDPGPVLFTQKRLGQNKEYFKLHKFRSMKMCTPKDVPTHMLENPEQYITKVGKFLRAHSLDELPQIWDIFVGNMSIVGPRPGLWNQDVLCAERDKYGANDVKPGLTGWAQINGRDELEIPDKAALDGAYVSHMGFVMDVKCFLGSVGVLAHDDSVVEGGTGEMKKARMNDVAATKEPSDNKGETDQSARNSVGRNYTDGKTAEELIGHIGFGEAVTVDCMEEKKVLITGAGSYIGEAFRDYAAEHYPNLKLGMLDMQDAGWREADFSGYDIVFHVAGIAHADVGKVDEAVEAKYYEVNTDLAVEVCKKAEEEGVKEFIFMSSMIVYGDSAPYGTKCVIDANTVPNPANFYGDSKLQADVAVRDMASERFKVIVLRPPMIYGKGSKGNYPLLAKLAKIAPVFPMVNNERSMLYIGNLCEFLCQVMSIESFEENVVVLMPQNAEWTTTCTLVKKISAVNSKRVHLLKMLKPAVVIGAKIPGKIGGLVNKAFGNSCYDQEISRYEGLDYQKVSLEESIQKTEGNEA